MANRSALCCCRCGAVVASVGIPELPRMIRTSLSLALSSFSPAAGDVDLEAIDGGAIGRALDVQCAACDVSIFPYPEAPANG